MEKTQRIIQVCFLCFLGMLVLLSQQGCKKKSCYAEQRKNATKNSLRFFKHEATGLCFAIATDRNHGYLANVPCEKISKELLDE